MPQTTCLLCYVGALAQEDAAELKQVSAVLHHQELAESHRKDRGKGAPVTAGKALTSAARSRTGDHLLQSNESSSKSA